MSWLTDLAGKAENLLNKIDQNAAVVLKDKNVINEQLQDVIWKPTSKGRIQETQPDVPAYPNPTPSPIPRSAPSGAPSPARRASPSRMDNTYFKRNDDDDLLRFLNSSETVLPGAEDARGSPSGASVPSAGSSSPVNTAEISSRSHSRSHSQGGMSSMSSSYIGLGQEDPSYQQCFKPVEVMENYNQEGEINNSSFSGILAENNMLKNEVRCLNNELSLLLQRSKAAEKEVHIAGQELCTLRETLAKNEKLQYQLEVLQTQLQDKEKTKLDDSSKAKELAAVSEQLKQLETERESISQEASELRLQISRLQATVADSVQQNERYRVQLAAVTSEAEQYKARATRVLQEKEKLIASLQAAQETAGEGSSTMIDQEIEQLREELQLLRQECASQSKLLQSARNDLQESELQQEEYRQKSETEIDRLQKKLQDERSRRLAAEEDTRTHLEDLQMVKLDMHRQCEHLNDCLRQKELEFSQLKKQYQISNNTSQASNSSAELESRVRSLATSLIQKQGALEALIAERNSLRLKLERFETQPLSTSQNTSRFHAGTVLTVNDSDSGVTRSRVPTLLSESPGDTGVARRVKSAYSSLDTLGIRVGVFLRRYPLARIFVILYMVLLHLWVAVVLFSYSPESQSPIPAARTPSAATHEERNGMP